MEWDDGGYLREKLLILSSLTLGDHQRKDRVWGDVYGKKGFFVNTFQAAALTAREVEKDIYIFWNMMGGFWVVMVVGRVGVGKRIVFVVVLFRRFLINDGYFEKDQMKKFFTVKDVWWREWANKVRTRKTFF